MQPEPEGGQGLYGRADIEGMAAETVELGDDENVIGFEAIEEAAELRPLSGGDAPGNRLPDDPVRADTEACGLRLGDLILRGLADR